MAKGGLDVDWIKASIRINWLDKGWLMTGINGDVTMCGHALSSFRIIIVFVE